MACHGLAAWVFYGAPARPGHWKAEQPGCVLASGAGLAMCPAVNLLAAGTSSSAAVIAAVMQPFHNSRCICPLRCHAPAGTYIRLRTLSNCCGTSQSCALSAVELMKPGSYITLRNAKVDMFRGSMRLAVNQVGAAGMWALQRIGSPEAFRGSMRPAVNQVGATNLLVLSHGLVRCCKRGQESGPVGSSMAPAVSSASPAALRCCQLRVPAMLPHRSSP